MNTVVVLLFVFFDPFTGELLVGKKRHNLRSWLYMCGLHMASDRGDVGVTFTVRSIYHLMSDGKFIYIHLMSRGAEVKA